MSAMDRREAPAPLDELVEDDEDGVWGWSLDITYRWLHFGNLVWKSSAIVWKRKVEMKCYVNS